MNNKITLKSIASQHFFALCLMIQNCSTRAAGSEAKGKGKGKDKGKAKTVEMLKEGNVMRMRGVVSRPASQPAGLRRTWEGSSKSESSWSSSALQPWVR